MADKEFTSFFMLRSDAVDLVSLPEHFSGHKIVPCEILSTDGQYLKVRVRFIEAPKKTGILYIPHWAIALAGEGVKRKQALGFAAEGTA